MTWMADGGSLDLFLQPAQYVSSTQDFQRSPDMSPGRGSQQPHHSWNLGVLMGISSLAPPDGLSSPHLLLLQVIIAVGAGRAQLRQQLAFADGEELSVVGTKALSGQSQLLQFTVSPANSFCWPSIPGTPPNPYKP